MGTWDKAGDYEYEGPPMKTETPQAAVSLIWHFMESKYLCVWNRRYKGWGLPGGKVEPGETLLEAQARELREETGLQTKEATLIYSAPTVTSDSGRMVYIFKVVPTVGHLDTPFELEPGSPVDFRSREELLADSPFKSFYEAMFKHLDEAE
jgi:8-oxo-dGTP pyrophosphatase MutT (NUDIX family)